MKSSSEILLKLKHFMAYGKKRFGIKTLGLFGSAARDEMTDNSDIDICIEFEKANFSDFMNVKEMLESELDCRIDLVSIHKYLDPVFFAAIKKDVIYV